LRVDLWNAFEDQLDGEQIEVVIEAFFVHESLKFVRRVLGGYRKAPYDEVPARVSDVKREFRGEILSGKFNRVLDLIEILVNDPQIHHSRREEISRIFERHSAPYWLDQNKAPFQFFPRSNPTQGEASARSIETLQQQGMHGATEHLRKASENIRSQEWGDSVRESIHAVESVARQIDPNAQNSLGAALKSLQNSGKLPHPALKEAFEKLYGYTSDEQGIRHALLDQSAPQVGLDEAMFMFGACASFAAYLVSKNSNRKA